MNQRLCLIGNRVMADRLYVYALTIRHVGADAGAPCGNVHGANRLANEYENATNDRQVANNDVYAHYTLPPD